MREFDKFRATIQKRTGTDDEYDYAVHLCWDEMISVFSEDMAKTIRFLETECMEDEYSWLSEVFEDIAEKTQNREFVAVFRKLADKYPEETDKYNVLSFINRAEACFTAQQRCRGICRGSARIVLYNM